MHSLRPAAALFFSGAVVLLASAVVADERMRPTRIEDPTGCALERMHRALADPEREGPVRIVHLGDSHVTSDSLTGEIRRRLQKELGIGGPGLLLAGRPWRSYRHADLRLGATGRWTTVRMNRADPEDGLIGLTGVALVSERPGAVVWAKSAPGAEGGVASVLEVHYVRQPGGGRLAIWVDGRRQDAFSTDGETARVDYWRTEAPEGPHRLEVRHVAGGPVRILGVVMERGRGLVYDALGTNGARYRSLDRTHAATLASDLERRAPSLLVFSYGTNEVDDDEVPPDEIGAAAVATIRRLREAAPQSSCLVLAPPDRAVLEDDEWKTHPRIPTIVEALRSAALRAGCAYWDTFAAMGGSGSIAAWAEETPALAAHDRVHLRAAGYDLIAEAFADALLDAHARWRERHTAAASSE